MKQLPVPNDWIGERVVASAFRTNEEGLLLTLRKGERINYAISTYRLLDGLMLTLGEFENIHDAVAFYRQEGGE